MIPYIPISAIDKILFNFFEVYWLESLLLLFILVLLFLLYNFIKDEIYLIKNKFNKKNANDFCYFGISEFNFKKDILKKNISFSSFLSINIRYIISVIPTSIIFFLFLCVISLIFIMLFYIIMAILNLLIWIINLIFNYSDILFYIIIFIGILLLIKYVLYIQLKRNRKK